MKLFLIFSLYPFVFILFPTLTVPNDKQASQAVLCLLQPTYVCTLVRVSCQSEQIFTFTLHYIKVEWTILITLYYNYCQCTEYRVSLKMGEASIWERNRSELNINEPSIRRQAL